MHGRLKGRQGALAMRRWHLNDVIFSVLIALVAVVLAFAVLRSLR